MTVLNCSLLCLIILGCVTADSLVATVGQDVTITCKYDAKDHGNLEVCWGRGAVPTRGCANEVIRTNGATVTNRVSERYVLFGNLEEGDVSLTIRQLEEADSGTYGCRVRVPGWFNDHKQETVLTVVSDSLKATVGQAVTITCKYDAKQHGKLPVCWGRGSIPHRGGCANEVIRTNGTTVTDRVSERYVLFGNLEEGDVSLTIRQLEEADSGTYGCRVDIPGWFNDHKHETVLTVVSGQRLVPGRTVEQVETPKP